MSARQSRGGRLSRSAEFERAFRRGRSYGSQYIVLYAFRSEDAGPPRLGLTVPRKVGSAVDRNLVKRLLREAFKQLNVSAGGHDVVLVARAGSAKLAHDQGLAGIESALQDVLARAGLIDAKRDDRSAA